MQLKLKTGTAINPFLPILDLINLNMVSENLRKLILLIFKFKKIFIKSKLK